MTLLISASSISSRGTRPAPSPPPPKPASDPVMGPGGLKGTFRKGNGIHTEEQNLYSGHCNF